MKSSFPIKLLLFLVLTSTVTLFTCPLSGLVDNVPGINGSPGEVAFEDVPGDHYAFNFIQTLHSAGITAGCAEEPPRFCPDSFVTRAQVAILFERSINGKDFTPPAISASLFADVPTSHWAAAWIDKIYADGIASPCSDQPLNYCPDTPILRSDMAIFLVRAIHGPDYAVVPATGIFGDVPLDHPAGGYIEKLYRDGILAGCDSAPLNFCPDEPLTRAEMAVMVVKGFDLK